MPSSPDRVSAVTRAIVSWAGSAADESRFPQAPDGANGMIPILAMSGFFLAMTAALQFSSWAEAWLTPHARSSDQGSPHLTSLASVAFPLPRRATSAARVT